MQDLTIGQLAATCGVGVETVRYYQRTGLLAIPAANEARPFGRKVRRYGEKDVRQLRFIRSAKAAGFTLKQIAGLISLDATSERQKARTLARERIRALDEKIAELERSREALQSLAHACMQDQAGPCPIITAFEAWPQAGFTG